MLNSVTVSVFIASQMVMHAKIYDCSSEPTARSSAGPLNVTIANITNNNLFIPPTRAQRGLHQCYRFSAGWGNHPFASSPTAATPS